MTAVQGSAARDERDWPFVPCDAVCASLGCTDDCNAVGPGVAATPAPSRDTEKETTDERT